MIELLYFKLSEFDSPDIQGSGSHMKESTLEILDNARDISGIPFIINSGFRTTMYNKIVKGRKNSAHLRGYAADIAVQTSRDRYKIILALDHAGFHRIGVYQTYIHVDNDPSLPERVIWVKK